MLPVPAMGTSERNTPTRCPSLLLVEAHLDTRLRHEVALIAAGYTVTAVSACPASHEIRSADVVLSDLPSIDWLHEQRMGRLPPMIAVTDDVRAGVMACLCGAAAWVPTAGDGEYLVDTVNRVLHLDAHWSAEAPTSSLREWQPR